MDIQIATNATGAIPDLAMVRHDRRDRMTALVSPRMARRARARSLNRHQVPRSRRGRVTLRSMGRHMNNRPSVGILGRGISSHPACRNVWIQR